MYRSEEEWGKLKECLKDIYFNRNWSYYGGGKFHFKFEDLAYGKLFDGRTEALLVANGTVALELAIRSAFYSISPTSMESHIKLGIPVLTVPMVKWAAERSGCVDEIRYLDVDPKTFCIREIPNDLDGIVWVHTGGLMSKRTEQMLNECRKHNILIIEDISHAYGSSCNGKKAGTIGHFVAGSFFGTKTLTCGEGGLVGTNSGTCYDFMKAMRNQGKNDKFEQVMEGYNYRASEFTAAIAYIRLLNLELEIAARRKIANEYDRVLGDGTEIRSVENELRCKTGLYKYIVRTRRAHKLDELMEGEGFSFTDWVHDRLLVHGDFPGAEEIMDGHVCLQLIQDSVERDKYINTFKKLWKEING